jgi:hypothetical protein
MTERRRTNSYELPFVGGGGSIALKRFRINKSLISTAVILVAMAATMCSAQNVISAHSGTLHYFEGDVSVDGAPVQSQAGRFSEIKEQSVLLTARGRAELLLTPGVFLRVGENSAIRMLDNRLVSTRLEVLSGTVIVESDDPQMSVKDAPVALIYKDYVIRLVRHGLVEISSEPANMRVYKGEAVVEITRAGATGDHATVKEGRALSFSTAFLTEKFDDKVGDDLYLWARDRSQSLSAANMSSALSLSSNGNGEVSGYRSGYGSGSGSWSGGWYFNPSFSMYTFVPAGGTFWNPWGYGFYSPETISSYYTPSTYWYGGGGARGTGSIGRPLMGIANGAPTQAAPLSSLQSGNSGALLSLGSPVRGGTGAGAETGFSTGGSRTGFASADGGHMSGSAGAGVGHAGGRGH